MSTNTCDRPHMSYTLPMRLEVEQTSGFAGPGHVWVLEGEALTRAEWQGLEKRLQVLNNVKISKKSIGARSQARDLPSYLLKFHRPCGDITVSVLGAAASSDDMALVFWLISRAKSPAVKRRMESA